MKALFTRTIGKLFGASNVPLYIDSDTKHEIYPNKWRIENGEMEVSHIVLTDKYPDAKILVEYFNLDPAKVVFFVRTNKVYIPYSNPIAILNDMDEFAGAIFIDPQNGMSFDTYLYNVSLPVDVYSYGRDMSDVEFFGRRTSGIRRSELNSIFHSLPTEICLLQVIFGTGTREIPTNLVKYLSKLDITDKNSSIFYSLIYADKSFRENLKNFSKEYGTLILIARHLLLEHRQGEFIKIIYETCDLFSIKFPEFAKIWEMEKKRDDFTIKNDLANWFKYNLLYSTVSSEGKNSTIENPFHYFLLALLELHFYFLKSMEDGIFDFSKKYVGPHFGNDISRKNAIQQFFTITHILDEIDDDKKISFVNMSSLKLIKDQIEIDCDLVIVKLPVIDSENKEINDKLRKKAEEFFSIELEVLGIDAKVYFF